MYDVNIFKDFFDYACNDCPGGYEDCNEEDTKDCWARQMYKQLQQLKQENADIALKNMELKAVNEMYKNVHKTEQERRRKFEQCLGEIEEIVTKYRVADSNLFMSMDIPNVRKIFEVIKQAKEE